MAKFSRRDWLGAAVLGACAPAALLLRSDSPEAQAADHRDGPIFPNSAVNGQGDLNDIYVFRSPANPGANGNTVFVLNFQPFPGNLTPATTDPTQQFDINIDTNGDAIEDITFRVTYGPPDAQGVQDVTLRGLPLAKFPPTGILARGKTGQNIPIAGGGMFRSAIQDDPFFFDAGGFGRFVAAGAPGFFPQPMGTAKNFFGPNGNTFSAIIEIPNNRIPIPTNNPNKIIGVQITMIKNGVQIDRMGRPAINTALIPPVPRNRLNRGERRNAFNAGLPRNDVRDFKADMVDVFTVAFGRTAADANFLASALLPDFLVFQLGNPGGFGTLVGGAGSPGFFSNGPFAGGQVLGNGRQFRDDVIDIELNLITNGAIPSDNVGDDNGLRITDGSVDPVSGMTRAIAFPYIGPANLPLNGPGTGPNP